MKRKRQSDVASEEPRPTRRARKAQTPPKNADVIDLTGESETETTLKSPKKQTKSPRKKDVERRLRGFRSKPPQTYLVKLDRARTQRLFVLQRTRGGTEEVPEEYIDIAGSTGNVYQVIIGKEPSCTCPDARKGNQCKHVVLYHVLRAHEHLRYQLAFLSWELRQIFENAPQNPTEAATTGNTKGVRKEIDGDCPICFMPLEAENESIVWCKAACGNNIHQTCFQQWVSSQSGKQIRCVYWYIAIISPGSCRTPWEASDVPPLQNLLETGRVNSEGYLNIVLHIISPWATDGGIASSSMTPFPHFTFVLLYRPDGSPIRYNPRLLFVPWT
ncbi:Znf1p [Nannizzia gypsea CBS 118893]|uniref:Znf1p n=1 Tax=Arthroderma gypseum (strain ATCC MYA-4604 / CBS 118893) TaxID=535722 RepID=E5R3X1_ARTGP|nr:Znf1p [Nannizzia gypsea CBS 118893]EFQ98817.1 Znf1p [Nannizzia gypsea CBS 118893]